MMFRASAAGQPAIFPWGRLSGDADGRWPLLLTSPHSGRHYPPALLAGSRLALAQVAIVDAARFAIFGTWGGLVLLR